VEREIADLLAAGRPFGLPDARSHPRERIVQLPFGLAPRPTVLVGAEREDLPLPVHAEAEAECERAVVALVHADLPTRSFLHLGLLVSE
jgi:hypothetical protein